MRALREKGLDANGLIMRSKGKVVKMDVGDEASAGVAGSGEPDGEEGVNTLNQPLDRIRELQGSLVLRVGKEAVTASSQIVETETRALVDWLYQRGVSPKSTR